MAEVTVKQFAEVLNVPVERLLAQLGEAGIDVRSADDMINDEQKMELLTYLRRSHGRDEAGEGRKITLKRRSVTELKLGAGQGKAKTVSVEVRKKRTYVKRSVLEEQEAARKAEEQAKREAEEAALRAQQEAEGRARQQQEEAVTSKQREEEEASRKRDEDERRQKEEEERLKREGEERTRREEEERRRAEEEACKQALEDERKQQRGKAAPTRYGRQELHVTAGKSGRRTAGKKAPRPRRGGGMEAQHGFEMPAQPVKREVSIPETITVAELANKMAVKATELIRTMMNMGVMATINQVLDQE